MLDLNPESLENAVRENLREEVNRRGAIQKFSKIVGRTGIAYCLGSIVLSDFAGGEDTRTVHRNRRGRVVGTSKTMRVGPVEDPVGSTDLADGLPTDLESNVKIGYQYLDNGNYTLAERAFLNATQYSNGSISPYVGIIQANNKEFKKEYGNREAKKRTLARIDEFLKKFDDNAALLALKRRVKNDVSTDPKYFDIDKVTKAYELYMQGRRAYLDDDYTTAHRLLEQSIMLDRHNGNAHYLIGKTFERMNRDTLRPEELNRTLYEIYSNGLRQNPKNRNLQRRVEKYKASIK
jgi:hypothetical protein